jgi:hypothetical protein
LAFPKSRRQPETRSWHLLGAGDTSQAGSHVRRFFLVDDTLSTPKGGGAPRAVVYPSSIELAFTIRADRRDHILPPLLTIT